MKNEQEVGRGGLRKPRVVEVVGPAGSGKTTLCEVLGQHPEFIRLRNFPNVRRIEDAPFFVRNGLQIIPSLLRAYRRHESRHISRREFAWMSILYGWPTILQKPMEDGNAVVILDQGPVFLMAEIRLFGPDYLKCPTAEVVWKDLHGRWATTLNMIVWLDAADEVLLERIRTRAQDHMVKAESARAIFEFLGRYRKEYDHLFAALETDTIGPRVLRFDTGQHSPAEIKDQLLGEFGCPMKIT